MGVPGELGLQVDAAFVREHEDRPQAVRQFVAELGLAVVDMPDAGIRDIDDCKAKLGHELSDCLWSILVLANKCGIDLEAEFARNTRELSEYVSGELDD